MEVGTVALHLEEQGWAVVATHLDPALLEGLRRSLFVDGRAGARCLLDDALVQSCAREMRSRLIQGGILSEAATAIQAIAFDKTPGANWKVAWHQDVMFPFARCVAHEDFHLPTRKEGVDYARPPEHLLRELLAVRVHLDDCGPENGPLRVSPRSHQRGLIPVSAVASVVDELGQSPCLAKEGEAVLMRPLTLHASSPAENPAHRRVLHLVYHDGATPPEAWHRSIS